MYMNTDDFSTSAVLPSGVIRNETGPHLCIGVVLRKAHNFNGLPLPSSSCALTPPMFLRASYSAADVPDGASSECSVPDDLNLHHDDTVSGAPPVYGSVSYDDLVDVRLQPCSPVWVRHWSEDMCVCRSDLITFF